MSGNTTSQVLRCIIARSVNPAISFKADLAWRHSRRIWPHNRIISRGAKTKTVIKASSLPQGALPPLPQDETDLVPERTYPTVLQQHLNNIRKFSDCIVLTRVGDFYEMYFEQVEEFAPLVNLKKAKRTTSLGDVPMAGFQHTQLDRYLKMFVQDLGKQVAISEQIRLPDHERSAKGGGPMYDRKVTRVITPGTLIDENFMDPYENNYLLAIHFVDVPSDIAAKSGNAKSFDSYRRTAEVGLSWVDLSSGDFFTQQSDLTSLPSLIARIGPRELVLDASLDYMGHDELQKLLGESNVSLQFHQLQSPGSIMSEWTPMLVQEVAIEVCEEFSPLEVAAGSLVLDYVRARLQDMKVQLQQPIRRSDDDNMKIDKQSLRNLEIRSTLRDGNFRGSLLHTIRQTVTKSGARLMAQRLVSPSRSLWVINNRLDLVEEMLDQGVLREQIIALLRRTFDTHRLLQKFSIGRGDADDLLGLARTIEVMQHISDILQDHINAVPNAEAEKHANGPLPEPGQTDRGFLKDIVDRLDLTTPSKVAKNIQAAIDEEGLSRQHLVEESVETEAEQMTEEVVNADMAGETTPKLARRAARSTSTAVTNKAADSKQDDIWIMRTNASLTLSRSHCDLDDLLEAKYELVTKLRGQLKAESLTLKWSAQLGHFCHIKGRDTQGILATLSGVRMIGSTKSTRSFYLSDWTHLGVRIDNAKLRIRSEEERVFGKLRAEVLENLMKLRRNAAVLDELDVACSSATAAEQKSFVRPVLNEGTSHHIFGGRHPTVDGGLKEQGRIFTSNDCSVGGDERIHLITGPNMGGKSTYLRQNALITILAQTGCFVPADYAEIGIVDKIFSRVGSADNLYQDQSTFMVEMLETADILREATPRSFVIMDEVGRGTTPEDGVAVGYACLHHLHQVNQCRALFATHFHVLTDMTPHFSHLACYCTDVAEGQDGSWTYVHRLIKGVNRDSHALKVARLAGLPESCIAVAAETLAKLQKSENKPIQAGDQLGHLKANA